MLYIIHPKDKSVNRFKIGVSADPERRMKSLQIGSPFELTIARIYKRVSNDRDVHEVLVANGNTRLHGEWFEFDSLEECISEVDKALRNVTTGNFEKYWSTKEYYALDKLKEHSKKCYPYYAMFSYTSIERITGKAVLFKIKDEDFWIPKSQLYINGARIYLSKWICRNHEKQEELRSLIEYDCKKDWKTRIY